MFRFATSLWPALALTAAACTHVSAPDDIARRYAQALEEGRLAEAYGLTSEDFRQQVSLERFSNGYASAPERERRATQIRHASEAWRPELGGLRAVREGAEWRLFDLASTQARVEAAQAVLRGFLDACDHSDFAAAYGLLSGKWRAQYTPSRFAQDFEREPLAKERLERARAALGLGVESGGEVHFPVGEGKAVRVVEEEGQLRIGALE